MERINPIWKNETKNKIRPQYIRAFKNISETYSNIKIRPTDNFFWVIPDKDDFKIYMSLALGSKMNAKIKKNSSKNWLG